MEARRKRVNQTPVTTDDTRRPTLNFDPFRYLKATMSHQVKRFFEPVSFVFRFIKEFEKTHETGSVCLPYARLRPGALIHDLI